MTVRIALSMLLQALGAGCFAVAVWAAGVGAYQYATAPASHYTDPSLSVPALVVPLFCGLVLLAAGQRLRVVYPPDSSDSER